MTEKQVVVKRKNNSAETEAGTRLRKGSLVIKLKKIAEIFEERFVL